MTTEELRIIAEKITANKASKEEILAFAKELDSEIGALDMDLNEAIN